MTYREQNRIFQIFGGEPIKLRWGGWVSDTYILQREGWKFHSEEHYEPYHNAHAIRLAVTSPDNYMVISGVARLRMEELMEPFSGHGYGLRDRWHHHGFDMQQYNSKDVFRVADREEVQSWTALFPADMTAPTMIDYRNIRMRDFKVFQPLPEGAKNEIFIPEENVDELLNKILRLQYPEQQEMKKSLILPERKPIIQAKIFSLAA